MAIYIYIYIYIYTVCTCRCMYTIPRLRFAVTQQGLVRISGHWAAGGREILPEQQAAFDVSSLVVIVRYSCPTMSNIYHLVLVDWFMNYLRN